MPTIKEIKGFLSPLALDDAQKASIFAIAETVDDLRLATDEELMQVVTPWKALARNRFLRAVRALKPSSTQVPPTNVPRGDLGGQLPNEERAEEKLLSPDQRESLIILMNYDGWTRFKTAGNTTYKRPNDVPGKYELYRTLVDVAIDCYHLDAEDPNEDPRRVVDDPASSVDEPEDQGVEPAAVVEKEAGGVRQVSRVDSEVVDIVNDTPSLWVCCDKCDKWRQLPCTIDMSPETEWTCEMHPDRAWRRCDIAEEPLTDHDLHIYECKRCGDQFATPSDLFLTEDDLKCSKCERTSEPLKKKQKTRKRTSSRKLRKFVTTKGKALPKIGDISPESLCMRYNVEPNTRIVFTRDVNPRSKLVSPGGVASAMRYAAYCEASTILEALQLAGNKAIHDIKYDLKMGWARLIKDSEERR
ncbi:hypothetical protein CTAYLR_010385 [Chrysophaeum taylorii]|uniref:CW-type domain-containing protein n=1 Tax=Chrysophaeum taylorii TaxID=2483200 RepID=A0AAD7XJX7_9STRA|nr:hypothetical protein CTAYLR_010385 [Chrysophaeum taylorii]